MRCRCERSAGLSGGLRRLDSGLHGPDFSATRRRTRRAARILRPLSPMRFGISTRGMSSGARGNGHIRYMIRHVPAGSSA